MESISNINYEEEIEIKKIIDKHAKLSKALHDEIEGYNNEKNILLKKYTVENGLIHGKLTIKCIDCEIKTFTYILKYLHNDFKDFPFNYDITDTSFESTDKLAYTHFLPYRSSLVKKLLLILCEGRSPRYDTWKDIIELFKILDHVSITGKIINEMNTESVVKLNDEVYTECTNNYLVKMANELIRIHFESLKRLSDIHTKDKLCLCYINKKKCPFALFPVEYKAIINGRL